MFSSVYWMDPLSWLESLNIEELCVVNGADRLFSCLDERFPDLETHDKIVFRLRVDKGECTEAYTGRCRELLGRGQDERGLSCKTLLAATCCCVERAWVWNVRLSFWRMQENRTRSETSHRRFVPHFRSTWCDQRVCSRHG